MGLFSSKKVTTVGTTVSRVIPDRLLPDSRKAGLVTAVYKNTDIAEEVMEEVVAGIAIKANRYYRYAKTKYSYGLPSGTYRTSLDGDGEVIRLLTAREGRSIQLQYLELGIFNLLHMGWDKLVNTYLYVEGSNEIRLLSQQKLATVYLEDIRVLIPTEQLDLKSEEELVIWGSAGTAGFIPGLRGRDIQRIPTEYGTSDTIEVDSIEIKYVWAVEGVMQYETLILPLPINEDGDYFHVKYSLPDAPQSVNSYGQVSGAAPNTLDDPVRYWTYKDNSGDYPELDAVYNTPSVSGLFFPFVYFRFAKQPQATSGTAASYVTSKKLVNIIGLDFDKVTTAINKNPDIKDIEQAMLIMAVPANTGNPIEQRYLYDFFKILESADSAVSATVGNNYHKGGLIIQDARFKMALSNKNVNKRLVGLNGNVGTHYSGVGTYDVKTSYVPPKNISFGGFGGGNYGYTISTTTITRPAHLGGGTIVTSVNIPNTSQPSLLGQFSNNNSLNNGSRSVHFYQKQITPYIREEIYVIQLRMVYFVYGDYAVTADDTDSILLIPIDYSISSRYPMFTREKLYARSLHYVFNSRVVTKVKWYQSSFFSFALKAVGIVFLVFSAGTSSALSLALVAAGFTATQVLVLTLIINAAIGLVVSAVLKIFVKAIGLELGILFAAVAAYYAGPSALKSLGLGDNFAKQLLTIVNGLVGAKNSLIAEDMAGLTKEIKALELLKSESDRKIEKANKLLEHTTRLNPFILFGETPSEYYNRTAHSGNIGVLSLDAISSFVEISLKLPTIDKTLGETTDG